MEQGTIGHSKLKRLEECWGIEEARALHMKKDLTNKLLEVDYTTELAGYAEKTYEGDELKFAFFLIGKLHEKTNTPSGVLNMVVAAMDRKKENNKE